jgi:signal transduction histidine kinase
MEACRDRDAYAGHMLVRALPISSDDEHWSPYIPLASAGLMALGLAAAVHQRHPFWDVVDVAFAYTPLGGSLVAAVIFLPFLLDALTVVIPRWKLRLPLWLFPLPIAAGVGYLAFNPVDNDFSAFVLVFTAAEVAARGDANRLVGTLGLLYGCAAMISAQVFGPYEGSLIWVIGIAFGYFGGFMVGELDRRKRALEAAQASLAEKAAADERSRIAREVHDVIAHSLSVTMLHVSAARMALQRGRTEDALEALAEADKQGRNSLGEVRRTVGLLGPDESATAAPMPGLLDIPKLAADFRAAGLDVNVRIDAHPDGIPAPAGLNLYRIVQEALTNAAKHSPGAPVDVLVQIGDDGMHVRVHNARVNGAKPNASGKGLGLRGMAERAALLGGRLDTDDSDGWTVTVEAPVPVS